jgi:hypothetical protein
MLRIIMVNNPLIYAKLTMAAAMMRGTGAATISGGQRCAPD